MPDDYLTLARQHKEKLAEVLANKKRQWRQEELPFQEKKHLTSEEFMDLFFSKLIQLNWKIDRDKWLVLVCPECDIAITKTAIIDVDDLESTYNLMNVSNFFEGHKPKCKAISEGEE